MRGVLIASACEIRFWYRNSIPPLSLLSMCSPKFPDPFDLSIWDVLLMFFQKFTPLLSASPPLFCYNLHLDVFTAYQGRSYIGGAGGAAPPGEVSVGKSSKSYTQSAN